MHHDSETAATSVIRPLSGDLAAVESVRAHLKSTYAIILAGGRGSRLHQLTAWRAKPAAPFGGKHRIIDFALSNCVNSGIRRIGVATQYKAHSLIRHLQQGWSFLDSGLGEFVEVLPAQQRVDGEWYLGTANAVFQNIDILRSHAPQFVLVLAGDHIYKMNYGLMLEEHVARDADASIACIEIDASLASSFGVVQTDESQRVVAFEEKPAALPPRPHGGTRALVSMGVYLFNAGFLYEALRSDIAARTSQHDFGRDVIPTLLKSGASLYAHSFSRSCVNRPTGEPYWRDVGTLDAFYEANIDLTRAVPALDMYDRAWPIRTLQEQLPPAKFIVGSADARSQTLDALVSSGCVVRGADIRRSMLFSNVKVDEGAIVQDSIVLPSVDIGRGVRLNRVVVDKYCRLPAGFSAGIDIASDRQRFYVSTGGVVLITPEMLGQSIHTGSATSELQPPR
jgi:glucose-1-phosphate adenylyltransferase